MNIGDFEVISDEVLGGVKLFLKTSILNTKNTSLESTILIYSNSITNSIDLDSIKVSDDNVELIITFIESFDNILYHTVLQIDYTSVIEVVENISAISANILYNAEIISNTQNHDYITRSRLLNPFRINSNVISIIYEEVDQFPNLVPPQYSITDNVEALQTNPNFYPVDSLDSIINNLKIISIDTATGLFTSVDVPITTPYGSIYNYIHLGNINSNHFYLFNVSNISKTMITKVTPIENSIFIYEHTLNTNVDSLAGIPKGTSNVVVDLYDINGDLITDTEIKSSLISKINVDLSSHTLANIRFDKTQIETLSDGSIYISSLYTNWYTSPYTSYYYVTNPYSLSSSYIGLINVIQILNIDDTNEHNNITIDESTNTSTNTILCAFNATYVQEV